MPQVSFQDIKVPAPGFGAMSFSGGYGEANDEESLELLKKAVDSGCTFWDSAAVYGFGHNESLIGRFFKENPGSREKVFVASKCGWDLDFEKKTNGGVTNKPEHIRETVEGSIKRLGTIPDLYYLHRMNPEETPLEESIKALDGIKKAGRCKYIGLSEPSAETLEKACQIAKIDALQIEYSPWFTEHESTLIPIAKRYNVAIIAYSPLGKGMLTGRFTDPSQFGSDIRSQAPRFTENFNDNFKIVQEFQKLAEKKGCTPGQLAIAWVTAMGAIPIPGTKNVGRFEENWGANKVELSEEELKEIREVITEAAPKGNRYGDAHMKMVGK